jgi:hypothetical protein
MLNEQWAKSSRSHTNGCVSVRWHKATASGYNGCVEVATDPACGQVQVRDTKDGRLLRRLARLLRLRRRTILQFTPATWDSLLMDVAAGHFHWSRFHPLRFNRVERAAFEQGVRDDEFELPKAAVS